MHIRNNKHYTIYTVIGSKLSKVDHEKDLVVTICNDLKPSKHCSDVVKTANKLVGFIGRTFKCKSEKLSLHCLMHLYALIWNIAFNSGHLITKKNIGRLKRIQRKVIEMILRLRNKSYEERLNELNLFSLSKHRLRGDLIEVFKNFLGLDNINISYYVTTDLPSTTRNHGFKIIGNGFRSNEAKHFFSIESWIFGILSQHK